MINANMTPKNNSPRDVCIHLLAMVTLYWSTISFMTLCWNYVDYFFPDVLSGGDSYLMGSIRFAVSSIIIVFPVFIWVSWYLNKIYAREPHARDSKIRKWLIYLTLFLACIIMITDLVNVINTFLGGEITSRFILKALSLLSVIGIIFGYYLDDARRDGASSLAKYIAWVASVIVFASVVCAFYLVSGPLQARLIKFDQRRITDLENIQEKLVNYWQKKSQLPTQLSDLDDSIANYTVPVDPQTHAAYEYIVTDAGTLSFQLCAVFNTRNNNAKSMTAPAPMERMGNWHHAAGRVCFQRNIDKQLYPPDKSN